MGAPPKNADETYSDKETARRRDEVVKRMLATPPQPRTSKAKQDSGKAGKAKKKAGKPLSR